MFFGANLLTISTKRTTGTNGRKLPGVTYQYVALDVRAGVEQGRELVFGEH